MMEQKTHLETIQEESEQEDATERSIKGDGEEEENFQIHQVVEMEEDEGEDDEALRCRRRPRSLRQKSFLQVVSTVNHQKEVEDFAMSDSLTHSVDSSDKATSPELRRLGGTRWSSSGKLKEKVGNLHC